MAESNRVTPLSSVEPLSSSEDNNLSPAATDWLAGSSAAMCQLRSQIRRVAPHFRTTLLMGERGCGEEAAAQTLHQLSPLSDRPFASLTPAKVELLFGPDHSPDNNLDNSQDNNQDNNPNPDLNTDPNPDPDRTSGVLAAHGLLYLPYPESLPRTVQTALLRLVRKRGSQTPRIVAFAEHGLRPLVSSGGFSAELAESLGSLRITIPPLRDRREDIPALLTHILENFAAQSGVPPPHLAPDLLEAAARHSWYGNLNQMHSVAEGLMERGPNVVLHAPDLQAILDASPQPSQHDRRAIRMMRLDDVIQEHVRAVLFACNGNKLRTAEVLGISRSTLYRMLDTPPQHALESLSPANLGMTG